MRRASLTHKLRTLLPAAALLLCAGCSEDSQPEEPAVPTPGMEFAVTADDSWLNGQGTSSRASLQLTMYGDFAIFAGKFTDAWDEDENRADLIFNEQCKLTKRGYYTTDKAHYWYWPDRKKYRFFAYAPYNLMYAAVSDADAPGTPQLTYQVPTSNKFQQDLLMATCYSDPDIDGKQSLEFDHVLTAVRFVASDEVKRGSVKSISINGIYSMATTPIGSANWTGHSHPMNFAIDFSDPINVGTPETLGAPLVDGSSTFILMPQTLPDEAYIEVIFIDLIGKERTFTKNIGGSKWLPGTIVTYVITPNMIYLLDNNDGYIYKPMF